MDFDALLIRYFDTVDPALLRLEQFRSGLDRARVDLGVEADRGRRFALWALLYTLGEAPELDVAFKDATDCDAARAFMDLADHAES